MSFLQFISGLFFFLKICSFFTGVSTVNASLPVTHVHCNSVGYQYL